MNPPPQKILDSCFIPAIGNTKTSPSPSRKLNIR